MLTGAPLTSQEAPPGGDTPPSLHLRVAILLAMALIVFWTWDVDAFAPLESLAETHRWSTLVVRPAVLWGLMAALLLFVRTLLWFGYRAAAPAELASAPSLTVIIPAYNEGAMVERSIGSVVAASYPKERFELIVVDDGSTDDTWKHIERAAAPHSGSVTTLRLPKNKGKRHALAEGFRRAKGDIVVTIDSDSVILPETLLALAGPFRDPRVGAVAGRVAVLNRTEGLIPRMLAARFVLTFDLLRAVQSTYGNVYCCPGALTAYRTSLVRNVLDAWLAQTFLGARCTIGEDRAMTNAIFEQGFDAVYQRTAVVHTVVPATFTKLAKMLLRWDRSYIREEIRYLKVVWKRPPRARFLSLLETTVTNLRYPIGWASLVTFCVLVPSHPLMVPRMLMAIGVFALFNMLYCLHRERTTEMLFGVLYAYFSFLALFWIFPYAALTVRARGWLTR